MKLLLYVLLVIAVLGGLFYGFRPNPETAAPTRTVTSGTDSAPPLAAASAASPIVSTTAVPAHPSEPASSAPAMASGAAATLASPPKASTTSTSGATSSTIAHDGTTEATFVIAGGKLTSGTPLVRVKQNDRVILHLTADTADELHLHGYNLHLHLKPGVPATLDFRASRTGRYTFELHHADLEVGALEVYPR